MIDRYTKIILTIIAICLIYLCFKPNVGIRPLQAGYDTVNFNLAEIGGRHLLYGEAISIKITD